MHTGAHLPSGGGSVWWLSAELDGLLSDRHTDPLVFQPALIWPQLEDSISHSKTLKHENRNIFSILLLAFKSQRTNIETALCEMFFTFGVTMMSERNGAHSHWESTPSTWAVGTGQMVRTIGSWKRQTRAPNQETGKQLLPPPFSSWVTLARILVKANKKNKARVLDQWG